MSQCHVLTVGNWLPGFNLDLNSRKRTASRGTKIEHKVSQSKLISFFFFPKKEKRMRSTRIAIIENKFVQINAPQRP